MGGAEPPTPFEFEQQIAIQPHESQVDAFTNQQAAWHLPHANVVPGSLILAQAALAAYRTVPSHFSIHNVQAQFLKAAVAGDQLVYQVQRANTSSRFACRLVQVTQDGDLKHLVTLNFIGDGMEDGTPRPFDHAPTASPETLLAASQPIDPELDDFNLGSVPGGSRRASWWPADTPYPCVGAQRLGFSEEESVSDRTYRVKTQILSALSSSQAQVVAAIYLSDMYGLETPLTIQGLQYGNSHIGDKTRTPTKPDVARFGTLNHCLHFYRTQGWDAQQGLLLEIRSLWAKGTRAVVQTTLRDSAGKLVATADQEGYYVFPKRGRDLKFSWPRSESKI